MVVGVDRHIGSGVTRMTKGMGSRQWTSENKNHHKSQQTTSHDRTMFDGIRYVNCKVTSIT